MDDADNRYGEATRFAAALLLSLTAVTAMEMVVASSSLEVGTKGAFRIAALAMWSAWKYLAVSICYALGVAAISLVPERGPWSRVRRAAQITVAAAAVAVMYGLLVLYEPFRGYLPFVVGYSLGGLSLAACAIFGRKLRRSWHVASSAALVALGFALHVANYRLFFGLYSTLHLAIIQAELLVFFFGIDGLLRLAPTGRSVGIVGTAALLAVGALGVAGVFATGSDDESEAIFVDSTVLGQSRTVFNDFSEGRSKQRFIDPSGVWRFEKSSAMPRLQNGFALEDYDVLLIASEATRFDRTTMSNAKTPSTPNLARRARTGLVFRNAYAPSSGTMHSLAGIFAMAYPSMIAMETWMKVWTGRLYDEEETVAESFRGVGYDTFWVGYNTWFPTSIFGFDQGFESVERIHGDADPQIADRAIAALEKRARVPRRFFGFVFFASPHAPYLNRGYTDLPKKRDADRYLQELRQVDTQTERVLQALERTGRAGKTIVIFLGDHGEEFKEHGRTRHKTTVYRESTHVPLVIWVPGAKPEVIDKPTSTAYVFPWLFSQARSQALRKRFEDRATHIFGPMLRETQGAVVVELVGHDRMRSALIYDDLKINYDFISNRIEAYALKSDPYEKKNLFASNPAVKSRALRSLDAYKRVRQAGARYVLKPKKKPPKVAEEE